MSPIRFHFRILIVASILALAPNQDRAQVSYVNNTTSTPVPGAGHDYIKLLSETVNPANGALSIRVQAPIPPDRGFTLPYFLFQYDSNGKHVLQPLITYVCNPTGTCDPSQTYAHVQSVSWSFDDGSNSQIIHLSFEVPPIPGARCDVTTGYMFKDPNGGRHALHLQKADSVDGSGCQFFSGAIDTLAGGDTQYKAVIGSDRETVYITDADGFVAHIFAPFEDRNGNLPFSLGRPYSTSGTPVTSVSIPGITNPFTYTYNSTGSFSFNVNATLLSDHFGNGGCAVSFANAQGGPGTLVTALTLPNGQQYQFHYEPVYGYLDKITYPTGAWVQYTWSPVSQSEAIAFGAPQFNSNMASAYCPYRYDGYAITKRVVSFDGTTPAIEQDFTYSTVWSAVPEKWTSKETIVTTHDLLRSGQPSFQTVYDYSPINDTPNQHMYTPWVGQIPVESKATYKDPNGIVLRTTMKTWQDPFLMSAQCEMLDNGLTSGTFYTYEASQQGFIDQVADKKEYDYGQVASGTCQLPGTTPARESVTAYQSFPVTPLYPTFPSIYDRPSSIKVYGNGTLIAETDFAYDETPVATVSPAPTGHDETNYGPSYSNRGNLTTKTVKCLQAGSCVDSVTKNTYDETGQTLTAMDANNNNTQFSYADSYAAGTGTPPGNTNGYVTRITRPTANGVSHISNFQYGYLDGQLRAFTDENGLSTQYQYNDSFARPTETDSPDGGQTIISYNDTPPSPSVTTTKKITSALSLTSSSFMDGLGHVIQSKLCEDGAACTQPITTDTTYDGLGRVWKQSNPHRSASSSTDGITTYNYDAIGRTSQLIPPDGSATSNNVAMTYAANSTTFVDQAGKLRRSLTDGLGRLVEVDEPGTGATTGTPGAGTATVSGTEQSVVVAGTQSTGSFLIGGGCTSGCTGTVSVTVGTFNANASLHTGSTPSSVAQDLISTSRLNSASSPVTATAGGGTINMRSKAVGTAANYSLSSSVSGTNFFTVSPTSGSMSGGTNGTTTYDTGTVSITVDSSQASISYGQGDTTSTIATRLHAAMGSLPVTVSVAGATLTLTATATGTSSNYSLSASSSTSQPATFSHPSFTVAPSGFTLTGGTNPTLGTSPAVTQYAYDALGNLLCAVQKATDTTPFTTCASASSTWRPRSFTYNSLSRLLTSINPESGTINYVYDANGNLFTKTAPAPNQTGTLTVATTFSYDALNRLTQKSFSDSTPAVKYAYDAVAPAGCTLPALTIHNGIGKRTGMCDAAGAEAWSYDITANTGWKISDARTTNGVTKTTFVQNNLAGMEATLTYPSGRVITYTPNAAARILSAVDATGPINYAINAAYTPPGALASVQNGGSLYSTFLYNSRLQPCWMYSTTTATGAPTSCTQTGVANAGILDYQYNFSLGASDNGSVNQITNRRDATRTQNFTYDSLNRIATAQTQTTGVTIPNANCWGLTFGYDAWGNLLSSSTTGPAGCGEPLPTNFSASNSNRISTNNVAGQITNYCYDAPGNLIFITAPATACPTAGPFQYTYNAENQLTSTAGLTYTYDGDGKRVQKSSGKLYWYGTSGDPLDETDAAGNTNNASFNEYVFFGGSRIARRDFSNNVSYYFADHLGTARVVANAGGTVLDDSDFYPFGGERPVLSSSGNAYKFTGKERDSESGLDNFSARFNSSKLGRFMSPDPYNSIIIRQGMKAGGLPEAVADNFFNGFLDDPQNWNKYTYALNNPLRFIDPTGAAPQDGHHLLVARDTLFKAGTLARDFAEQIKTGPLSGNGVPNQPGFNILHQQYNEAVKQMLNQAVQEEGPAEEWTLPQWKDFASKVLNSTEPAIKNFLDELEENNPGAKGALASSIAAYRVSATVFARIIAGALARSLFRILILCVNCDHVPQLRERVTTRFLIPNA
jgi:RHS repeat-associated protein